tara:strand:+ start:30 stop:224 length:195 start_codon:yes stop_codon:yes gene_type:complete
LNTDYLTEQSEEVKTTTKYYFSALMADGCVQQWIVKECQNEQDFREHLNQHYPFHICLYCKQTT